MKNLNRHIILSLIFLVTMTLLVGCSSSSSDEVEGEQAEQQSAVSGMEEKYEQQPSFLQRFLKRYGRKGAQEAQKATGATKSVSTMRKYNRYYKRVERQINTGGDLVDSKLNSQNTLKEGVEVFGWHPHYMGNAYESYNFNLLTTIAYFSYDVDPETGGYRSEDPINDWKTTGLIDSAHAKGCDVLLTVTNHGRSNNNIFLTNLTAQQNLIDSLISLLELRDADGINIDFEALPSGITDDMTRFVKTISTVLKQVNPKYQISIALPAVDHTDAFDIPELLTAVDRFVIMGYDYHSGASKKPGPVAPLPPKGSELKGFNLQNTVDDYLEAGLPQSKMIMAFPYYGRVWEASNSNFSDGQFTEALTYRVIKSNYEPFYEMHYDSNSTSYYFDYKDTATGQFVKCWFDNELTLGKKYDWVNTQKLRGVGIWALGYDNGYTELWSLIDDKFAAPPKKAEEDKRWFAKYLAKNGTYVGGGIAFIILFMFIGLAAAMAQRGVSHELFDKRWFLFGFIFVFMLLFILWLHFMGWVNSSIWYYFIGIWLGYLLINYMDKLKINTHSDLP